jgi:putative FmdB family regulatory protein
MAFYDFVCDDCGHAFEVFSTGFIKPEQRECPECGSHAVRQKFSSFLRSATGSGVGGCAAPSGSPFT